jgi:hypothetical protein
LGTPYPRIVADVAEMMERYPLPGCTLAVDGTGVGAAVVGQFRAARVPCRQAPVVITAGRAVSWVRGELHAAKMQLASVLQKLLGEQRLKVAPIPDHRETLEAELRNFSVKVSADSGALTYEALREGDHDDMVLAVACALIVAERTSWKMPALPQR